MNVELLQPQIKVNDVLMEQGQLWSPWYPSLDLPMHSPRSVSPPLPKIYPLPFSCSYPAAITITPRCMGTIFVECSQIGSLPFDTYRDVEEVTLAKKLN